MLLVKFQLFQFLIVITRVFIQAGSRIRSFCQVPDPILGIRNRIRGPDSKRLVIRIRSISDQIRDSQKMFMNLAYMNDPIEITLFRKSTTAIVGNLDRNHDRQTNRQKDGQTGSQESFTPKNNNMPTNSFQKHARYNEEVIEKISIAHAPTSLETIYSQTEIK